ncbi:MAG: ATP-binding protein [Ktedonobacteraceae bacterium]
MALFIRRAQRVTPDFQLTGATAPAVAEICVRLDGLPLALELAAARMKLLSPEALLAQLGQRLHVLTSGAHDVAERQQTLRNTIAWSYQLLDAQEQQLFRWLSVFAGGGPLPAVEAICAQLGEGAEAVLDMVASLVDKSLLQRMKQKAGEEPRFVMLETIREYGLERLEALGEMEVVRRAHAAYFLRLAEEAERELWGSQQAKWLEHLEREHDNLGVVMQWSLEQTEDGGNMALRLGGALGHFWFIRSYFSEGQDFLERALTRGDGVAASVRAKALSAGARLHEEQGDHNRAEVLCQESLALYQNLGDTAGIAAALHLQADVAWGRGNLAMARSLAEQSLALFRERGDKGQFAYVLLHLGSLAIDQGEYARARTLLEESLVIHRELGDTSNIADSLFNLARLYYVSGGDLVQAHSLLEESFALYRELGDRESIAYCLYLSGILALGEGDMASAHSRVEQAVALFQEMRQSHGTTISLHALAKVATAQEDYARSQALYEESIAMARKAGDKRNVTFGLEGLASAVAGQGKCAWAVRLWGAAEAVREAIGAPMPPVECASYKRAVAAARAYLGEQAFAAAWSQGREMTPEQALAQAN